MVRLVELNLKPDRHKYGDLLDQSKNGTLLGHAKCRIDSGEILHG